MSEPINMDVAVVGAGPSGLIAAILIAGQGFRTALVAPAAPPEDWRTTALFGGSTALFEAMGLADALAAAGTPVTTMRLVDVTGRLIRAPEVTFEARETGRDAFGFNILNRDLTRILAEHAAATANLTRIEASMAAAEPGERAIKLVLDDGRSIVADLAVAADGRHSALRTAAGIKARTWDYPQSALVLNFECQVPHEGISTEFHGPAGPFVLVPLGPRKVSVVLVETRATAEALAALDDDALALDCERRCHSLLGRLTVASPRQIYPLSGLAAERFGRHRVALVGEAGHVFPPIGAQGLNLSLRDVAHLAEVLVDARRLGADIGGAETLERYDRGRAPDVRSRTVAVDLLDRSLLSDALPFQVARGVGLALAERVGSIRRLMMREGLAPSLVTPRIMRR
jgi:2-octaprenyl-6-methoxyphenol hydroxylase